MTKMNAILYFQGFRYQLTLEEGKEQRISQDHHAALHIATIEKAHEILIEKKETWVATLNGEETPLSETKGTSLTLPDDREVTIFLSPVSKAIILDTLDKKEMIISSVKGATVELANDFFSGVLTKEDHHWHFALLSGDVYVNNQQATEGIYVLEKGDQLSFAQHTITVFPHELYLTQGCGVKSELCEIFTSRYSIYEDYPDFHRSPRIIYREPEEKVTLNAPSEKSKPSTEGLVKIILPPLMMLAVTIGMAFLRSNLMFVLASGATTLVTLGFSIQNYFKTKKEHAQSLVDREVNYRDYLNTKAVELHQLIQEQKQGQHYHYPNVMELLTMTKSYSPRIYEKTALHFDFLYYRLGLGQQPASFEINYANKERGKQTDELEEAGYELYEQSLNLQNMPIQANLMHGPVGYIGPRNLVLEQLHLLVNQLAVFHSYHDLQFISIFPEAEKEQWNWMRWLPHATLQDVNVRGFVYNQRSRDQVLNSLNQILKNRKNALEENRNSRESTLFSPHYVVMITDEKLILDHVVMEFFNEDPSHLGCSVIFVEDVMSSLSDNIKTVIDIRDRNTGVLLLEEGNLKNTPFQLDHFPEGFDKEELPRLLAPLNHLQNLKSSIPEAVTFLEMYGLETFDEFNVTQRWAEHSPHKTLAVPLGLRGKDDIVYLNLHEKAHGPHGLVAGTTGSGKSEIIQSYILSLAVNFHPYDVAFLLIDYKGGGMANLFRHLPHLLGTITNLDGAQSMRALISINAELKRRQRLFSENNVNHINQYQKLYKSGDVKEPMPHLFLISDEFAELKAEQPEFMKELVSTARIGRSLGIHLILATQKPSGVVNDQIWSNSKFKLALKVADKADSMEMLKTPDAAEITQAGRAYLQVGNNEIYELFQSAWSGADYAPEKEDQQIEDHTIYLVNELGQYELLTEDLSGLENADEVKQIPTELDAIIDGIHDVAERENIAPLPRPWLPPLAERIALSELHDVDFKEAWATEKQALKPVIGLVDIPSMQAQETLELNLTQEGHVAVFSSPGYGKSMFMQTVAMDLARVHNPERLNLYLLDFGTNGLLPLKRLPHVADTMSIDEEEKIVKFTRRITDELKRRKKLLSEYAVASLDMYERASGNEEPIIMILVDGYEGFKGSKFEEPLEKVIMQVAREGAGIGVHLLISAGRQNSLRMNLYSNIKTQIALKLIDDSEPRAIVGRTNLTIEDLPGRGLIKLDEPESFQTALPAEGEDTLQIIEAIQAEVKEMDEYWTGGRPEEIPMVPEDLNIIQFNEISKKKYEKANGFVPLGLDLETVSVIPWDSNFEKHLSVIGASQNEVENTLKLFIQKIAETDNENIRHFVHIVDTNKNNYDYLGNEDVVVSYLSDEESMKNVLEGVLNEQKAIKEQDIDVTMNHYFMIVNIADFGEKIAKELIPVCKELYEDFPMIKFITFGSPTEYGSKYDEFSKLVKQNKHGLLFMKYSDQSILTASNLNFKSPKLMNQEAYYVINDLAYQVKIPLV